MPAHRAFRRARSRRFTSLVRVSAGLRSKDDRPHRGRLHREPHLDLEPLRDPERVHPAGMKLQDSKISLFSLRRSTALPSTVGARQAAVALRPPRSGAERLRARAAPVLPWRPRQGRATATAVETSPGLTRDHRESLVTLPAFEARTRLSLRLGVARARAELPVALRQARGRNPLGRPADLTGNLARRSPRRDVVADVAAGRTEPLRRLMRAQAHRLAAALARSFDPASPDAGARAEPAAAGSGAGSPGSHGLFASLARAGDAIPPRQPGTLPRAVGAVILTGPVLALLAALPTHLHRRGLGDRAPVARRRAVARVRAAGTTFLLRWQETPPDRTLQIVVDERAGRIEASWVVAPGYGSPVDAPSIEASAFEMAHLESAIRLLVDQSQWSGGVIPMIPW